MDVEKWSNSIVHISLTKVMSAEAIRTVPKGNALAFICIYCCHRDHHENPPPAASSPRHPFLLIILRRFISTKFGVLDVANRHTVKPDSRRLPKKPTRLLVELLKMPPILSPCDLPWSLAHTCRRPNRIFRRRGKKDTGVLCRVPGHTGFHVATGNVRIGCRHELAGLMLLLSLRPCPMQARDGRR